MKKSNNANPNVKVNQQFVDELISAQKAKKESKSGKSKRVTDVNKMLEDDRFKSMFEDKDFARDPNSDAYKQVKPVSLLSLVCG